ncbi:MAG: hypothetical protein IJ530_15840 [Treponema sp.]|uniref:hypothetical protein n=1 Tax=Treponema sp. TaxID=166 RepID=UPI0025F29E54|nr:hypothetical protein [Treponema sp.]MBQ8681204.1 hypothetical protein [Treponema sp.]MBR1403106.1 hypothetical protein [Treponema sp.]
MKRFLIFLLCISLFHAVLFSEEYLNNPTYIAQKGAGATESLAQQNSLASLSRFFQQSISVEAKEHTDVTASGSKSILTEDISVKSEVDLFAVHYTKAKFDKKQKLYEVIAYIDREEAWKIYVPRLNESVSSFENLYANGENKKDLIQKIVGLSQAKKNAKETELSKKFDFAMILNPDQAERYESTRTKLSEIGAKIKRFCSQCSISIFCENDYENRINQSATSFFSNLGFTVQKKANDGYECSISVTENAQTLAAGIFFTPSFKIEITKGGNTVFSGGKQLKKIGAKNESVVKQRAFTAIADAVKQTLNEEFASF